MIEIPIISVDKLKEIENTISGMSDIHNDSSTDHSIITYIEFFGSFTCWPTISSFTIALGEEKIVEYVTTWYYEENWLYCIDFILQQSDEVSDFYTYEVKVLELYLSKLFWFILHI